MEVDFKIGSIVYRVWRTSEGVNAKSFFVVECDGLNLICQNDRGEYYKFNYFEDNLLTDKDLANELYVLYKNDYKLLKEKVCKKEPIKQIQKNSQQKNKSGFVRQRTSVNGGVYPYAKTKKPRKNIFENLAANGFTPYKLTSDRMIGKLFTSTTDKEQVPNLGGEELNVKAVVQNSGYQTFDFSSKNKRTAFATRVKVGSRVGLLYAGDRTVQYYTIVKDEYSIVPKFASGASRNKLLAEKKSKGSDINNNEITEISPTAKAVMGKTVGQRFVVNVAGKKITGCIVSIS